MGVDHPKNFKYSDYGEKARRKMNTKYHAHVLRIRSREKECLGHRCNQVEVPTGVLTDVTNHILVGGVESERGNLLQVRK